MSASSLTLSDLKLSTQFSNLDVRDKIEQLQKRVNYTFKNPSLLHRALTRQNAIQEQHPNAYTQNFEALEFVGDAALKHGIARLLYTKYDGKVDESQLHDETVKLIANEGVMPQIARQLKLDELIIKGKGELLMTSNILADSLEALLGAIAIDCDDKQQQVFRVIKYLWQPYLGLKQVVPVVSGVSLPSTSTVAAVSVATTVKPSTTTTSSSPSSPVLTQFQSRPSSSPADYQRLFTGIGESTSVEIFRKHLTQISDVNRRSSGTKGNTALIMLLDKPTLRKENELPKIKALLERGANWEATNNKDESAETFALRKHGGRDAVIKMTREL